MYHSFSGKRRCETETQKEALCRRSHLSEVKTFKPLMSLLNLGNKGQSLYRSTELIFHIQHAELWLHKYGTMY